MVAPQPEQSLQQISSQFRDALRLDTLDQNSENKVCHCLFPLFLLLWGQPGYSIEQLVSMTVIELLLYLNWRRSRMF
jgi:hypothetical protein